MICKAGPLKVRFFIRSVFVFRWSLLLSIIFFTPRSWAQSDNPFNSSSNDHPSGCRVGVL